MRVAIHQPNYIPWLGFWDKMMKADVFILLDTVQFEKNEYQNRQKIKFSTGEAGWLTVPIHYSYPMAISKVQIDDGNRRWVDRHLHALYYNYNKAGWWEEYGARIEEIYKKRWPSLSDFNVVLIELIKILLRIPIIIFLASRLTNKIEDLYTEPNERIMDLCEAVEADCYLSGAGAKDYLDQRKFADRGIRCEFQEFKHPAYRQLYGEFISHLSIMDLLLNVGAEEARKILELNIKRKEKWKDNEDEIKTIQS